MLTPYHPQFIVPSTQPIPAEMVIAETQRLRLRDRWVVEMLAEHRTLTTVQLTALGFATDTASATRRLKILARRGWIDRLLSTAADDADHTLWCAGPLCTHLSSLGSYQRVTPAQVYRARDRLCEDPRLPGLLHANDFFIDLATRARTQPGTDLRTWWSPRTCRLITTPRRAAWHGEYIHASNRHAFWYEPDPGSIHTSALANRVHHYRQLAEQTGLATLLFHAEDPQREQHLRWYLDRRNVRHLTVVTSNPEQGHPADPVWQPIGETHRLALTDLPHTPEQWPPDNLIYDIKPRAPHPVYDPDRPGDESIADGEYHYPSNH
ncbi:replication-relaxation family protein [Micromonospora sp. NPDC005324]|uniref:replication-relaxation family protein n=1 Tax=Micromonospora sp. NPDC005324 TaxID=3157033 RepID=UPI0033B7A833